MSSSLEELGELAYEAFRRDQSDALLPAWPDLTATERDSWEEAARAVAERVTEECD